MLQRALALVLSDAVKPARRFILDSGQGHPGFTPSLIRCGLGSRASNQRFFIERRTSDVLCASALAERMAAETALHHGDSDAFIAAAFRFQKVCETLCPTNPMHLDQIVMSKGLDSHMHSHYRAIFSMCFEKALTACNSVHRSPNNFSGYYFTGPSGIGKSTILASSAVILSQLLPNTLFSVYVDAASALPQVELSDYVHAAFDTLVKERRAAGDTRVHEVHLSAHACVNEIACELNQLGMSLLLFVDEAHLMYSRGNTWPALHSVATSPSAGAVFLSGDAALLVPMARRTSDDVTFLVSKGYSDALGTPSLNETKVAHRIVSGLSTPEQLHRPSPTLATHKRTPQYTHDNTQTYTISIEPYREF